MLEDEIMAYTKIIESENKNESFVVNVYCTEINDSTNKYVINGIINPELIKMTPYHFICKIGERDVFFTMLAGIVKKN